MFRTLDRWAPKAAVTVVATALLGCAPDAARDPVAEYATTVSLDGQHAANVTRSLARGVYLLSVRETDMDVRVAIRSAGATTTLESQHPRHGVVFNVVSLARPGEIRIEITSQDHKSRHGSVEIQISRWSRSPDGLPSEREAGYAAQSRAAEYSAVANLESWPKAVTAFREAAEHFAKSGDDMGRAEAMYSLADVEYGPRDNYNVTVTACDAAIDAFTRAGDLVGAQNAATLKAAAQLELSTKMDVATQRDAQLKLYGEGDRTLAETATFFETHGLPVRAQYAVNMRAVGAVYRNEFGRSASLLAKALAMARANRDTQEEIRALGNLAAVDYLRGNALQAVPEYASLVPLLDREHQPYSTASVLGNYGIALSDTGDFDRALTITMDAISIYARLGEDSERAIQLTSLGELYLRMGDGARALDTIRASLPLHERFSDPQNFGGALRTAARVAASLELHSIALQYLRKARRVNTDPAFSADTDVLIAGELLALGRLDEAEAMLAKIVVSQDEWTRARGLIEHARLDLARRNPHEAIDELRTVTEMSARLGMEFNRIESVTLLSDALLKAGDVKGAMDAADEAIGIVDRIHVRLANSEWRSNFLSSQYPPFEARIAAEFAGGAIDRDWRALRIAESVRARSLTDELANGPRTSTDARVATLVTRLTTLQVRLESRLRGGKSDDTLNTELRRDIAEARGELDSIRSRDGIAVTGTALPDSIADVQALIPEGTAVLAYFVGDQAGYAWLLTHDAIRSTNLADRKALERALLAARREERTATVGAAGRTLGRMLLGDLLDGVEARRLLVLPDGLLNSVAFAALPLAGDSSQLVVDRYVVSTAPSLALALRQVSSIATARRRIAVISDPVYARSDRRLARLSPGAGGARGEATPMGPLQRLPYSATEARAVLRAFQDYDVVDLKGFDAVPSRVLALPSQELGVLHFATHAVARPDEPDQSALFLSEYSEDGRTVSPSRLTAEDIARSGLRADLVVLSGCSTGEGRELRGEGVLGLTHAFLANGSNTVVASLWPVEDALTARFMEEFYAAYRATGRATDALRTAQLRTRGTAAASIWASFVVRANALP